MLFLAILILIVFIAAYAILTAAYRIHPMIGIIIETVMIATTIAQKGLKDAALNVYKPLARGEINQARRDLSMIVGRDTEGLAEQEITRGAIETVAENTSDGITAPLFWAMVGGGPFAMIYRAVNTCDSMVGYKNKTYEQFGFASAKMDDILNWIPSRVTSLLMVIVNRPAAGQTRKACWMVVKRDAKKHPSPNSGWGETAVAALLGIQLGGENRYQGVVSNRAVMGRKLVSLQKEHIIKSIAIMNSTTIFFVMFLWVMTGLSLLIYNWMGVVLQ